MKKFILTNPPDSRGIVYLKENDFHYLVRIRRLGKGSVFTAFLPDGTEKDFEVISAKNDILKAQCVNEAPVHMTSHIKRNTPNNILPPIYLFQALPKGSKMDLIIRQAGECGISRIIPFYSEYSQIKNKVHGVNTEKIKRWNRIIKEARQQSGSVTETQVNEPCVFDEVFIFWDKLKKEKPKGSGIFFNEKEKNPGTLHDCLKNNPDFVAMAIGPEGGFNNIEAQRFKAAGFKSLSLGDNILRTETAALYGAAAIRTILLERAYWKMN